MVNYTEYLTKDYKIDFKKLYKSLSEIQGFRRKEHRMELYNNVISWYKENMETSYRFEDKDEQN